jgi:hypothetical protein
MEERLVQWTLLRNLPELSNIVGKPIVRKLAQEYTTDLGRIDLVLETPDHILVVELETIINSKYKLSYCTEQLTRYMQISYAFSKPMKFAIIFDESTPLKFQRELVNFANKLGIILKTYSLPRIQELYSKVLDELKRTSGLNIGSPVAMDVTHLRYLNRVIELFKIAEAEQLPTAYLRASFRSRTSFGVYKRLAEDFELAKYGRQSVELTKYGVRFRDALNRQLVTTKATMPDLSMEQKRILLEVLTNGNFTKCKVNIYYFLRFVHLTNGEWLPRPGASEDKDKLEFINFLFSKSYRWNSASELLSFTCNQCEELDLVSKVKMRGQGFDKVIMMQLGSRVLGFLELHLHLKREQIQIPLSI